MIHNHACNERELPACCQQHLQRHHTQDHVVEKKVEVVDADCTTDAKENQVQPPTAAVPPPSAEEERAAARLAALRTQYASYLQMLKVGLPRVVVNHKMRAENKDPAVLDELIASSPKTKKVPAPIEIPQAEEPVEDEDPEYAQKVESFQRMLKVGVPRHIVEMKAKNEGVDPAELNKSNSSGSVVALKPADDNDLPTPAKLSTRSRRSSISSAVSTAPSTPDALAMRSASTLATSSGRTLAMMALRKMNTGMRKKLHWSTTPYTGALIPAQRRDSLWSRIHAKAQHDRVCISTESRRWMEKLFVKVAAKAKVGRRRRTASGNNAPCESGQKRQGSSSRSEMEKRERSSSDPALFDDELDEMEGEPDPEPSMEEEEVAAKDPSSAFLHRKLYVVLLDHKKSQNIAIVLARVKRTFPELTHEILTLNCNVLSSPALQSLIDMWPDSAEQEAIDQFDGDVSNLATVSPNLLTYYH
ncbi:unnamed protein product [Phytophthora lilii]|uniref:Unnamed protein product n=1 Tax=Phytophthora lilii TaxID=2077276 RepID=A0A9W6TGQ7_9STRA|nr:unnamed protein product [Phytophthora lilii]